MAGTTKRDILRVNAYRYAGQKLMTVLLYLGLLAEQHQPQHAQRVLGPAGSNGRAGNKGEPFRQRFRCRGRISSRGLGHGAQCCVYPGAVHGTRVVVKDKIAKEGVVLQGFDDTVRVLEPAMNKNRAGNVSYIDMY